MADHRAQLGSPDGGRGAPSDRAPQPEGSGSPSAFMLLCFLALVQESSVEGSTFVCEWRAGWTCPPSCGASTQTDIRPDTQPRPPCGSTAESGSWMSSADLSAAQPQVW